MASVAKKFSNLMSLKRDNMIIGYNKKMYANFPVLVENFSQELYDELEMQFAKTHTDLKIDFYNLDCQYKLLRLILNKSNYIPHFDLLVTFENLSWLEKLLKEFNFNLQESKAMLKLFLKHIIPFYINNNVRNYNMALSARDNAEAFYGKGIFSSFENTIKLLQNPDLEVATADYLVKREACLALNEVLNKKGIEALFSYPELLKVLGFSEQFLNSICIKSSKKEVNNPSPYKKYTEMVITVEVEDPALTAEKMKKYIIDDEPVGIIEGEDFQKFLELARKLYTSEKISLLKEKIVLNNRRIQNKKRLMLRNKIIHEKDRDYYTFLTSIDLTDPDYLPYISFIQSTITTIENFVDDLVMDYSEDLVELYLEETIVLLNNIKSCIPYIRNR